MKDSLVLTNVHKHFGGARAVDAVSFSARPGTITCLLGRNGSGKTTTIRMINGIFSPDAGQIEVLGFPDGAVTQRDHIGYLPEERGLYGSMRVLDLLIFFAALKGKPRRASARAAEVWLERLELEHARELPVAQLSKGNQQKVQLIVALLHDPELLILDEPMSGLDPVSAQMVRDVVVELRRQGRTILVSTHVMELAQALADEIVLLDRGRVILSGRVDDVRRSHARAATRVVCIEFSGDGAFMSTLPNVVQSSLERGKAELALAPEADPATILAALIGRVAIHKFELVTPSLETVFVDRVGSRSGLKSKDPPCSFRDS